MNANDFGEDAYKLYKLACDERATYAQQVLRLTLALQALVNDGECYCSDNVAVPGPCSWCIAKSILTVDPFNR